MTRKLRQFLLALTLAWLLGCAGGGSEIPNLIATTGSLVFLDGTPADSARVYFIATDFVPVPGLGDSLALFDSTMTDQNGEYEFDLVSGETVNILASRNGQYSFRSAVASSSDPLFLPTDTLRNPGSLAGVVQVHPDSVVDHVAVAAIGTNRYAQADPTGQFVLADLAPGSYRLAVYALPPVVLGPPDRSRTSDIDTTATIATDIDVVWGDTLKVGW